MRNPTYEGDFIPPGPETMMSMCRISESPVMSIGIKTITHNRDGLRLHPHQTIVIEMREGDEVASFDMPPSLARMYAKRLSEFADRIETMKAPANAEA